MYRPIQILPLLALASTSFAQIVIPSAAATTKPNPLAWNSNIFYSTTSTTTAHDSHTQSIYDVNDISTPAGVWNSLAVRRPVGLGNSNAAFTTTATVKLSVGPNAPTAASTTFANNLGASVTTVINGPISLPAANNQATWPAPWQTPFAFSVPFVYAKAAGAGLVIDILQVGNTGTAIWYLEATGPDNGSRAENGGPQSTCKFSNGNYNSGLGYTPPRVGGSWYLSYSSILPNAVGFGAIGGAGVGGNWGSFTLPIDLGQFGATGCKWSVSADFTVPLTASATGSAAWTTIPIPNNPSLGGGVFYDHAAFIDLAANSFGIVTTWSSKWTVGTGIGAPACTVGITGNSAQTSLTGSLAQGSCATFQLQ